MSEIVLKECKIHGITKFYRTSYKTKEGRKLRYRCGKCNIIMVSNRRRKLKVMAIEYKGGKCCICGYSKSIRSMQFHHLDPKEKDFGLGGVGTRKSWEEIKKELDKCILVCANCHGELEDEIEKNK